MTYYLLLDGSLLLARNQMEQLGHSSDQEISKNEYQRLLNIPQKERWSNFKSGSKERA